MNPLRLYDGRARRFEEGDWQDALYVLSEGVKNGKLSTERQGRVLAYLDRAAYYAVLVERAIRSERASQAAYLGVALGELLVAAHSMLFLEPHAHREWARVKQLALSRRKAGPAAARKRQKKAAARRRPWLGRANEYRASHPEATVKDLARWIACDEVGPKGMDDSAIVRPIYRFLLAQRRAGKL